MRIQFLYILILALAILVAFLLVFPASTLWRGAPIIIFMFLAMVLPPLFVRHLYVTVGIGRDEVILKRLLGRMTLRRDEVERIVLSRKILSDDTKHVDWWGFTPRMTVKLRDGREKNLTMIQDGIKLRMARVLDPENHPTNAVEKEPPDLARNRRLSPAASKKFWKLVIVSEVVTFGLLLPFVVLVIRPSFEVLILVVFFLVFMDSLMVVFLHRTMRDSARR